MKIVSITLLGIKCFFNNTTFDFSIDSKVNAVSGKNGSGKTAVFKAIQLFQKLFFYNLLGDEDRENYLDFIVQSSESLVSSDESKISISFDIDGEIYSLELSIKLGGDFYYEFHDLIPGSFAALSNIWNPADPKSIVVFIDANKSFSDFSVGFDNISLKPRSVKEREFLIDCVFNPENALRAIYKRTALDHIHYRIDPSRTYDYFKRANDAVKRIVGNIEVKNISSTKVDGNFVMLGKTRPEVQLFDVKDFSSGERALYLCLLFLFYVKDIGILIIDEPENHFHEDMLSSFYKFIYEILEKGNLDLWHGSESENTSTNLQQVFLVTHSKLLIHRSIVDGKAYVIRNNGSHEIASGNMEITLRDSGISSVLSRKLFVEGNGDLIFLSNLLASYGVEVVPLGDCKEVVDHFKKISTISDSMFGTSFCFVVDRDNRPDSDFEEVRKVHEKFYDSSFILLDRHEIESYLIDCELIFDTVNQICSGLGEDPVSKEQIIGLMRETADDVKEHSKAKYVASRMRSEARLQLVDVVSCSKRIKIKGANEIIEKAFEKDIKSILLDFAEVSNRNFEAEWDSDWQKVVDGKAFVGMFISKLSRMVGGLQVEIIKKTMLKRIRQNEGYVMNSLVKEILGKFDIQKLG